MKRICLCGLVVISLLSTLVSAKPVTVDMAVGESFTYKLANGQTKTITVLSYKEYCDELIEAIRKATVTVDVDGVKATINVVWKK